MKKLIACMAIAALLAFGAGMALAQPPAQGPPPGVLGGPGMGSEGPPGGGGGFGGGGGAGPEAWGDKEVRELVELALMAKLSREADLNDEQTLKVMRVFQETRDAMQGLVEKREGIVEDLRTALADEQGDEAIAGLLENLRATDEAMANARLEASAELKEDFTPTQQAKLYLLFQDFRQDMQRLMHRARGQMRPMMDRQRPERRSGGDRLKSGGKQD